MIDLSIDCKTGEGLSILFSLLSQGLHVFDCSSHFGVGKYGCVFGSKMLDNRTRNGDAMHAELK